jgi:hypothetical protein
VRTLATAVASVALAVLAAGCGGASEASTTGLEDGYQACQFKDGGDGLEIADAGDTIIVDTGSGSIEALACLLVKLDTPTSVVSEIDNTTALMGSQHAESGDYKYQWSYHPDNGLNMVITDGL